MYPFPSVTSGELRIDVQCDGKWTVESLGIYIMDIIKISPLNNPSSSLPDGFVIRYNDNYEDETDTKEGEGRRGEEVLCRYPTGANLPDEERCGLY